MEKLDTPIALTLPINPDESAPFPRSSNSKGTYRSPKPPPSVATSLAGSKTYQSPSIHPGSTGRAGKCRSRRVAQANEQDKGRDSLCRETSGSGRGIRRRGRGRCSICQERSV